jgi:hypothetical protein
VSSNLDDNSAGGQRAKEERVIAAARAFAEAQLAPDTPAVVAISGTPAIRPDLRESWMVRVESAGHRLIFVEVIHDADGSTETRRYRT